MTLFEGNLIFILIFLIYVKLFPSCTCIYVHEIKTKIDFKKLCSTFRNVYYCRNIIIFV